MRRVVRYESEIENTPFGYWDEDDEFHEIKVPAGDNQADPAKGHYLWKLATATIQSFGILADLVNGELIELAKRIDKLEGKE